MFENIGSKMKTIAIIVCWAGIIASCVVGISFLANGSWILGICTIVLGSLVSWLSSLFTYGFGQLIDNTDTIIAKINQIFQSETVASPAVLQKPLAKPHTEKTSFKPLWPCAQCGEMIAQEPCPHCGHTAYQPPKEGAACGNCGYSEPYEGNCPRCGSSIKKYYHN